MVPTITDALRRVKDDLSQLLRPEAILELCRQCGHEWRQRVLDPVTTIHVFALQILHGNTACAHLPHLANKRFNASAYCQARARLPLELLEKLLQRVCEAMQPATQASARWHGHRTHFLDGSGFSTPDTAALQNEFGQPGNQKPGCGFPVGRLLVLFHAGSGLLLKVLTAPLRSHDLTQVASTQAELQEGDLLLGDRGFCSYAHLALLSVRKIQAVFRMHHRQIVDFTPGRAHVVPGQDRLGKGVPRSRWLRRLGVTDQWVEWFKPEDCPPWMTAVEYASLPASLTLRELRYRVGQPGFRTREITLVTTLLDPELYSSQELAELYRMRWRIETNLRHLKTTMHMDVLRCETVAGVRKELTMFALVYNLVRLVMLAAAERQKVDVERISFVDALRWLAHAQPGAELPSLVVNPYRPNRLEPRAIKRRYKEFDFLTRPRKELRKQLLGEEVVA